MLDVKLTSVIDYLLMNSTTTQKKIYISETEYHRLKKFEKRFSDFLDYFEHLIDIRSAREEVKKRKTIPQERLFKRIGI